MANIKSAQKRIRQERKRNVKNSQLKSTVRTATKNVVSALEAKTEKDPVQIQALYKKFVKTIDTATGKGVVHKKTASRKKSRLAKKVNSISKTQ